MVLIQPAVRKVAKERELVEESAIFRGDADALPKPLGLVIYDADRLVRQGRICDECRAMSTMRHKQQALQ